MELDIELIVPFVFAVAIVETILSGSWNSLYFKTGIPIYRHMVKNANISKPIPGPERLELAIPHGKWPRILIRSIDNYLYAFREKAIQFKVFLHTNNAR